MASEVVGASVLTGVLDLVESKISVENIHQCIDDIMKVHMDRRQLRNCVTPRVVVKRVRNLGGIRFRRFDFQSQDRNACSGTCFQHR